MESNKTRRLEKVLPLLSPLIALLIALLISVLIVYATIPDKSIGETTKLLFQTLYNSNLKDRMAISNFIVNSTPLILTGLANAIAFKTGLFNIGVEGQYTMAAITAAALGLIPNLSPFVHIPLVIIGSMLAGALWAFIPGFFKATRETNEVVNTIMMNYIALHTFNYIVRNPLKRPNTVATKTIEKSAQLYRFLGDRYRINVGIFIALAVALLIYYIFTRTKMGYELRATGANMFGAEYGGINKKKNIILAMSLSGAVAGIAAITQIMGPDLQVRELAKFTGFGLNGIAVALLAKSNPIGVIFTGLLFGSLLNAGPALQMVGISKELVYIIQALVILFVAADYVFKMIINRIKKREVAKND